MLSAKPDIVKSHLPLSSLFFFVSGYQIMIAEKKYAPVKESLRWIAVAITFYF